MINPKYIFVWVLYLILHVQAVKIEHEKIIQKNHFSSNSQKQINYSVANVNTTKPLIYLLKKTSDKQLFNNTITVKITSGDQQSECIFKSFSQLCLLKQVPDENVSLLMKCESLPCQVSWTILQPFISKMGTDQPVNDLYDISKSNNHLIVTATCNNPEITNFHGLVEAYSEDSYQIGYSNTSVYYLFDNQQKGHLYFKVQQQARTCIQINYYEVPTRIQQNITYKDFIMPNKTSTFKLPKLSNQFRFDCSMHQKQQLIINSQLFVSITGNKDGIRSKISKSRVKTAYGTMVYDFNYAVPHITDTYTDIQVQFETTNKIIIINFQFHVNDNIQVQQDEHSYFSLKNGQILRYKLVPNQKANEEQKLKIFMKQKKMTASQSQCSKKQGCEFIITAQDNINSYIYIGQSKKLQANQKQIIFEQFQKKATKKIKEDDTIYFKKQINQNSKAFQLLVNSPNVIMYASIKELCQTPSPDCYQKIGNIHNPILYEAQKEQYLLIAVLGLQNCEFTLSVVDENQDDIPLEDNIPFSYLMSKQQNQLVFSFQIANKIGVSFNLISSLNQLTLYVAQGTKKPNSDTDFASVDGFIDISKQKNEGNLFKILVKKNDNAVQKFIHFTIIASTSQGNLRLQPGNPHYQNIKQKETKQFIFEYDKQQDYIINLHAYNNPSKQNFKLNLLLSSDQQWSSSKVQHIEVTKFADAINVNDIAEQLCEESGQETCQVFLKIANNMKNDVDLTITLLIKDSIIQLKEGLWQNYAINSIAQSSHFYFIPKFQNQSITIMYKSSLIDLSISYILWKSDEKNMNYAQWPFPSIKQQSNIKQQTVIIRNHLLIDKQSLHKCWPYCVVLISLFQTKDKNNGEMMELSPEYWGNFMIMASSKLIELPQKTKIQISLQENEQKHIIVDLKNAMDKEALTFFTSTITGFYNLYAQVSSSQEQRCPDDILEYDFDFGEVQTQIKLSSIQKKIEENNMEDQHSFYLCILAEGGSSTKFAIQYSSDQSVMKILYSNSLESVKLVAQTPKIYQLQAEQQYRVKIIRNSGDIFTKTTICDKKDDDSYQQCLDDSLNSEDKGKKMLNKTQLVKIHSCSKCLAFLRLQSDDEASATIHVTSQYSVVQLQQNIAIYDFLTDQTYNKYEITALQEQDLTINIQVSSGEPIVTVSSYGIDDIKKEKSPNNNNIHIVIPSTSIIDSSNSLIQQDQLGQLMNQLDQMLQDLSGYKYSSTFKQVTVTIQSKDPSTQTAYTISYSSGKQELYLQDGLITGYTLEPNKKAIFYYKNQKQADSCFMSVSMDKSSNMYNLSIKMFKIPDQTDLSNKQQLILEKPPLRKKTQNPSITYSVPPFSFVSFELESSKSVKVQLMINHKQLILLPIGYQFPFQTLKNDIISFTAEINDPGIIQISIRKCNQSSASFGFTLDEQSFRSQQFDYTSVLEHEPMFDFYLKSKKKNTLYLQLNSTESSGIFVIKITQGLKSIPKNRAKAGNNGIIEYQLKQGSQKAFIKFHKVECQNGNKCGVSMKYIWAESSRLEDVYSQTVCPYSFFQTLELTSISPIKFTQITVSDTGFGMVGFEYQLISEITYISIKAIVGDYEIYYQPIEIVSFWGQIKKNNKLISLAFWWGIFPGCLICCALVLIRKKIKRSGYTNIPPEYSQVDNDNDN